VSAPRVLVCGKLPEKGRAALEAEGIEVDHRPDQAAGSLAGVIGPFAGVVINSPHQVDAATIQAGLNLRVVGRAGVGVDNVDVEAASAAGVLVMNMPSGNTISAAEHTIAMMMALARNIGPASAALRSGTWERARYQGVEVDGKTLAIIGLGRIGLEVARRAQGMGMHTIGSDPIIAAEAAAAAGVELMSVDELLPRADFLTVHVPLIPPTRHLLDADTIGRMKPGARLLNCARGGIVDEGALLAALESGHLAGAACDVFEAEPTDNAALLAHPAFLGTPHLGASTAEARERVGEGIARQVAEYLAKGVVTAGINAAEIGVSSDG
jgi:D-3-phosphoglycerate dehydrogenase